MSLLLLYQASSGEQLTDVDELIAGIVLLLNAAKLDTLTAVSQDELFEFADEAALRLARSVALFVTSGTITQTAGTATVALPTRHLSTIHVSAENDADGVQHAAREGSVAEFEALDSDWETVAGDVERWSQDQEGLATLRVYKTNAANTALQLVYHEHHATLSTAAAVWNVPKPVGDVLTWAMLAEVRARESDEAMPEVAEYARERVAAYEELFRQYWGSAQ